MGFLSELHADLETISQIMGERQPDPVLSAEEQMERRCDHIIRELDELCAFANNPETVDLVDTQRRTVGQMKTRIDLIASLLDARQSASKVVSFRR